MCVQPAGHGPRQGRNDGQRQEASTVAKVNAPILSIGASGAIGKTQVYGTWRGVPYARQYVVPSNPRSSGQTQTRSVFAWSSAVWKIASSLFIDPWNAFAKGQPLTGRNAFIGKNTKAMRAETDLTMFIATPGSNGGIPPSAVVPTGGSGQIAFAFTNPTPPVGWTLSGATAFAILAQNPQTDADFATRAVAATSPYTAATITGLAAGSYVTCGWLTWTKPDGSLAFSPGLEGTASVT